MKQGKSRPVNRMMQAASVLACLVLVSLHMVCGLYARYTTTASGSDGARVAKFQITTGALGSTSVNLTDSIAAAVVPGVPFEAGVEVTNASEVAVSYTVRVENETNNLPLELYVRQEGGTDTLLDAGSDYSFSAEMAPGAVSGYRLKILLPKQTTPEEDLALMGMVDKIAVTLSATQID